MTKRIRKPRHCDLCNRLVQGKSLQEFTTKEILLDGKSPTGFYFCSRDCLEQWEGQKQLYLVNVTFTGIVLAKSPSEAAELWISQVDWKEIPSPQDVIVKPYQDSDKPEDWDDDEFSVFHAGDEIISLERAKMIVEAAND